MAPTRRSTVLVLLLALTLGLVLVATPTAAQTTGAIRGEVTDTKGDPLPGVTVVAKSTDGRVERTTITGSNGRFSLASMPVADYQVTATLSGFQPAETDNRVSLGTTSQIAFILQLESVDEVLNVTAEAPVVDVSSSKVGTNFNSQFIEELPTDRNFWDMIAVAPGMSPASEGSTRFSAFGSSVQSNSWNIDGLDATASETGNSWWWINPDTIEEIQILGIGAPAEYGNMLGAAFNVVTKSGTNTLHGNFNWYQQNDSWTTENAEIEGIPFHRDRLQKVTGALSGPVVKERLWYFLAHEFNRDTWSDPGVNPNFPSGLDSDRSDLKLTAALGESSLLDVKLHYEDYDFPVGDAFATPSATAHEFGTNPAWGIHFQTALNANNFLEAQYAGYTGEDNWLSITGSLEPPFIDYSPPGGGPTQFSGSVWYPYLYELSRDQLDVKLSHHTDDFLRGDHSFKFGIAYGRGENDTIVAAGPTGTYYYRYEYYPGYPYYYKVTARPYHYGAETDSFSAFADDSWQLTDKLTLNLGVRFDQHNGKIPAYPELNQVWQPTGGTIPGINDVIDWTLFSPRIGMAYELTPKSVLRAFYGKFFDANVTGNWDAPPPQAPSYHYAFSTTREGPYDEFFVFEQERSGVDPNLKAPETDQYTIGWEQQFGRSYSLGVQAVYKDTQNLIGWEILDDGVYETVPFTNPLTGQVLQLASIIEQPTVRKGNRPGAGSLAPPGSVYSQKYKGLVLSFNKRFSKGWQLMSSYTWSDSEGLSPRPLSQVQGNPFYTSSEGRDPNNWLNARQALQGDREHVLQIQTLFNLPYKFVGSFIASVQDGRPYSQQVRAGRNQGLNQGLTRIIAIPASKDRRLPTQSVLDASIGRRFDLGKVDIKVDLQVLNVTNEDSFDFWQDLTVGPGEQFVPDSYIFPRRAMLRLGIQF